MSRAARAVGEGGPRSRVFTGKLFRERRDRRVAFSDSPAPEPVRRPARVAKLLATAHRLQAALDEGQYQDRAGIARHFGLTRARVTQLLNLTLLAPDIQEEILGLESVDGRQPLSERSLRTVVRWMDWSVQRVAYEALRATQW